MYLHKKDPDEELERWAQGLNVTAAFAENPSSVLSSSCGALLMTHQMDFKENALNKQHSKVDSSLHLTAAIIGYL